VARTVFGLLLLQHSIVHVLQISYAERESNNDNGKKYKYVCVTVKEMDFLYILQYTVLVKVVTGQFD